MIDPDEMRAWQYREENPGYQREISPITPTAEDMLDPDWHETWQAAQEQTDAENRIIRKSNEATLTAVLRSERDMLREQLRELGVEPREFQD